MSAVEVVDITYFSDVLCIWAYISQARVDAVTEKFGDAIRIKHHFCSVFSDTARKIPLAWSDKGSYEGFNSHLRHVAERFPHIELHPDVWLRTRPATSTSAHLFLKAVQQWEHDLHRPSASSHPCVFDRVLWDSAAHFSEIAVTSRAGTSNAKSQGPSASTSPLLRTAYMMEQRSRVWRRTTRTPIK